MLYVGDCLEVMKKLESNSVDLIYLDPPFFTQDIQVSKNRKTGETFMFNDKWENMDEYLNYLKERLKEANRVLRDTGSIFVHCDNKASHYLKVIMDEVYGYNNFQSEIIWYYKRWSNAKKGLLNNYQNILFYSKTENFKFNKLYNNYSESTNIDQMFQQREKDSQGRSVYKKDNNGNEIMSKPKKGVPMNDVWEIPFLNPTAKERVGYPTQKPIELIDRIINLVTDQGDVVLDPFVGSGTTVVSAKLLNRNYIGIDKSKEAINLTKKRLDNPIKTESNLVNGKIKTDLTNKEIELIENLGALPVKRNKGIDGVLKEYYLDQPIFFKIQKNEETFLEAKNKLLKARRGIKSNLLILIMTQGEDEKNIKQLQIFDPQKEKRYVIEELVDGRKLAIIQNVEYQLSDLKKGLDIF